METIIGFSNDSMSDDGSSLSGADEPRNLIIVVRADPIICGHSTEARNLAEAAIARGYAHVAIITWSEDLLASSGLPLKPASEVEPYSAGIAVLRSEPVGSYKILDGRYLHGMTGDLVNLLLKWPGHTTVMGLYLVPHGRVIIDAVRTAQAIRPDLQVTTIAEAVGSDITDVVTNATRSGAFGAAAVVLQNYLDFDLPVAVSDFTKQCIIECCEAVDEALGSEFAAALAERVQISYPAIDASLYEHAAAQEEERSAVLNRRGLDQDGFVLFLSRLVPAKGVDDLIEGYRSSACYGQRPLVICGAGPAENDLRSIAGDDPWIKMFTDVSDNDKVHLMHACCAYCLPSKPRPEFVETFGIAIAEKMLAGGMGLVITTRTGGIPEATGEHGLIVNPSAPEDITAALNHVAAMTDEERAEAARAAQAFARSFDRGPILARLEALVAQANQTVEAPPPEPFQPDSGPVTLVS